MGRMLQVICGVVLAVALLGAAQSPSNTPRSNSSSYNGEANAAENVQVAANLGRIASALEAQNTDTDADRKQRDLNAQEGMAKWAKWMFWAAAAQAILAGIGIVLIWITFQETRRAADSAEALVKADRAWMTFHERVQIRSTGVLIDNVDHGPAIMLSLKWINCGRSPAREVALTIRHAFIEPDADVPVFAAPRPEAKHGLIGPGHPPQTANIDILEHSNEWRRFRQQELRLIVYSKIWYADIYSPAEHWTEVCAELRYLADRDGMPFLSLQLTGSQNGGI